MSILGDPTDWAGLIDPMVPVILDLVVGTWADLSPSAFDEREDNITESLCRALRQNRSARDLPFQIDLQVVELDPAAGEDQGRLDISFRPLIPREDIYFCLECKRLNVLKDGKLRTYASEYVLLGMKRFVTGQYAKLVRHGGMIGYVLDGNAPRAIANVEANVRAQHMVLCMTPPGKLIRSRIRSSDTRARESHHTRQHSSAFQIHHLFLANHIASVSNRANVAP